MQYIRINIQLKRKGDGMGDEKKGVLQQKTQIFLSEFDERILWTYRLERSIIRLTRNLLVFLPSGQTDLSHFIIFISTRLLFMKKNNSREKGGRN